MGEKHWLEPSCACGLCAPFEPERHSVALVYVHGESVKSAFMSSVLCQVTVDDWAPYLIGSVKGQAGAALVAEARNNAVRWFLDQPGSLEWLWFVDADIEIMASTLQDLLAATQGEPGVFCAAAWGRMRDGPALVWAVREGGGLRRLRSLPSAHCTRLEACGTGCTLIHRTVLERVAGAHPSDPWPWFGHDIDHDAAGKAYRLGEDFSFCLRVAAAGFPVFGVNTPVRHHKLVVLDGQI